MTPKIEITLSEHLVTELIMWMKDGDQKEYRILTKDLAEIVLRKDDDITIRFWL